MLKKIISLSILLVLLLFVLPKPEFFVSSPETTILTSQRLNYEKSINQALVSLPYQAWEYVLYQLTTRKRIDLFGKPTQIILDPIDTPPEFVATPLPKGYFMVFTDISKKDDFQCGFDLQGKKIGFFDRWEQRVIESILYGYRITAKPRAVPISSLTNLSAVWKEVDVMVLFVVPGSPMFQLIESQPMALLDLSGLDMDRIRITYPSLALEEVPKEGFFTLASKIVTPSPTSMFLLGMTPNLVNLLERKPVPPPDVQVQTEGFITRLNLSPEFTDPSYQCINEETTVSKQSCNSPYDIYGIPKKNPTFTDKPCTTNEECPFFKANKNYPNEYGACQPDGTCQMPIGMVRMGYTKYFDRDPYQPFCYQCKNPKDTMCCEDQVRLTELNQLYPRAAAYTHLKSADYAFPNDTQLREEAKLPTTIPLPIPTIPME